MSPKRSFVWLSSCCDTEYVNWKGIEQINTELLLFLSDALDGIKVHNKTGLNDAKRLLAGCEMGAGSSSVAQR